jgi:hypothetical protein
MGWEERPLAETWSHGKVEALGQTGLKKSLKIGCFRPKAALPQLSQGALASTLEARPAAALRQ